MWGLIAGLFITLSVSALGLVYIIVNNEFLFTIFKYAALAYMLYLTYKIWNTSKVEAEESSSLTFVNGFLLNSLNPKAYIGAFAILTQFVNSSDPLLRNEFFTAAVIFISVSLIDFAFCYLVHIVFNTLTNQKNISFITKIMAILLLLSIVYVVITG